MESSYSYTGYKVFEVFILDSICKIIVDDINLEG